MIARSHCTFSYPSCRWKAGTDTLCGQCDCACTRLWFCFFHPGQALWYEFLGPYHLHQIQVSLLFLLQYLSQVFKLLVEVALNLCAILQTEVTNDVWVCRLQRECTENRFKWVGDFWNFVICVSSLLIIQNHDFPISTWFLCRGWICTNTWRTRVCCCGHLV